MVKITVRTEFGKVDIHNNELRELVAKHLAAIAAEAAREPSGGAIPATGKKRGRPPGSKNSLSPVPAQNGPSVDPIDPPARPAGGPL
jgi:hypothetical protein